MPTRLTFSVSLLIFILSVVWFFHSFLSPSQTMIGDRFGYDPGSSFLPIVSSLVLMATSLMELFRWRSDWRELFGVRLDWTVVCTILAMLAYMLLFTKVGFILSTSLLIYGLILLNRRHEAAKTPVFLILSGIVAVVFLAAGLDYILGLAGRLPFSLSRSLELPALRSPGAGALISALIVSLIFGLAFILSGPMRKGKVWMAAAVSLSITFGLYIIFRQLFFVRLPDGLLSW